MNLTNKTGLIRHSNAVAAGTSAITPSSGVALNGADGVRFIAGFGAIVAGAVTSIKAQQSNDNGVADDWTDIAGSKIDIADTDDNKLVSLEIYRPQKDYVRLVVSRATQNATLDFILAERFGGRNEPMVNDSATVVATAKILAAPAEGTA